MANNIRKTIKWFNKSHPIIFSITLLLLALIIVILVAFLCLGYSFAIRENVCPNWEAIGTVLSFIAAVSAIWAAVFIPWRIAEKQNRISLFNEKFTSYQSCEKFLIHWRIHLKLIINNKNEKLRLVACFTSIQTHFHKGGNADELIEQYWNNDNMPADLSAFISDIHQESTALFDRASCIFACLDSNDTEKLSDAFSDFFRVLTSSIFAKRTQRGLVKACEAFQEEIVKFINNEYLIKMRNEIEKIEV